jgi:hypothetical protein
MTEVIYFVLGVGLALIGFEVYLMIDTLKRIKQTENGIAHSIDEIRELHRRIDIELDQMRQLIHTESERFTREIFELSKYIDSRIDKTEFKLTEMYKNGCEPVKQTK